MTNAKLNAVAFFNLTLRGFRIFIRDRAGVFFSLLAPLIILMLYLLFLGICSEIMRFTINRRTSMSQAARFRISW